MFDLNIAYPREIPYSLESCAEGRNPRLEHANIPTRLSETFDEHKDFIVLVFFLTHTIHHRALFAADNFMIRIHCRLVKAQAGFSSPRGTNCLVATG